MSNGQNKETDAHSPLTPDTRMIAIISGIAGVALTTLFGLIGFLGKDSFTPIIFDQIFGLSQYVNEKAGEKFDRKLDTITEKVDSGYTESIAFSYDPAGKWKSGRQMLFYAEKGQDVTVSLFGNATGKTTLLTQIDGSPKNLTQEKPFMLSQGLVTERLCFDCSPGGNIHVVRFKPQNLKAGDTIVVDALVLVYSKTGKKSN